MEYLIQLNDGPLDGVEMSVASSMAERMRNITIDLVSEESVDDIEEAEVKSASYDLYIDEPTAAKDGSILCFYHDRSTMLPKHPLAKIHHRMSNRDKKYWNKWLDDITDALAECFQHVSPEKRRSDRAIKAYERAQRRLAEVPKLRTYP